MTPHKAAKGPEIIVRRFSAAGGCWKPSVCQGRRGKHQESAYGAAAGRQRGKRRQQRPARCGAQAGGREARRCRIRAAPLGQAAVGTPHPLAGLTSARCTLTHCWLNSLRCTPRCAAARRAQDQIRSAPKPAHRSGEAGPCSRPRGRRTGSQGEAGACLVSADQTLLCRCPWAGRRGQTAVNGFNPRCMQLGLSANEPPGSSGSALAACKQHSPEGQRQQRRRERSAGAASWRRAPAANSG